MEQDKYTDSTLQELLRSGFKPMRALLKDGRSVLTDYYISPRGEIGKFTKRGFKLYARRPDKDGSCRRFYNVLGRQVSLFRHRLVAHNFNQRGVGETCCGHIDFDTSNDVSPNLNWHTEEQTPHRQNTKSQYPDRPIAMLEQIGPSKFKLARRFSARKFIPSHIDGVKIDKRYVYKNCLGRSKTFRGYAFVFCSDIEKWKKENGCEVV